LPAYTRSSSVRSRWRRSTAYRQDFAPDGATDPLLYYVRDFRPKLVLHSHESYPVGHLSTIWIGLRPGDLHLNIVAGWAKHAWSCFFAPWNAGAWCSSTTPRFDARALLDVVARIG
jgi:acetyl-CoA synthetase